MFIQEEENVCAGYLPTAVCGRICDKEGQSSLFFSRFCAPDGVEIDMDPLLTGFNMSFFENPLFSFLKESLRSSKTLLMPLCIPVPVYESNEGIFTVTGKGVHKVAYEALAFNTKQYKNGFNIEDCELNKIFSAQQKGFENKPLKDLTFLVQPHLEEAYCETPFGHVSMLTQAEATCAFFLDSPISSYFSFCGKDFLKILCEEMCYTVDSFLPEKISQKIFTQNTVTLALSEGVSELAVVCAACLDSCFTITSKDISVSSSDFLQYFKNRLEDYEDEIKDVFEKIKQHQEGNVKDVREEKNTISQTFF